MFWKAVMSLFCPHPRVDQVRWQPLKKRQIPARQGAPESTVHIAVSRFRKQDTHVKNNSNVKAITLAMKAVDGEKKEIQIDSLTSMINVRAKAENVCAA